MKKLKRMLMAVMIFCIMSASAFALDQKDGQKPPPKGDGDNARVHVEDKNKPAPPRDDNRGDKKGGGDNKKGKP